MDLNPVNPAVYKVFDPDSPKDWMLVRFEWHTEKNQAASDDAGMALFDRMLLAFISSPGNMRSEANAICERVRPDGTTVRNERSYQRFGEQIEKFKKGEAAQDLGVPLEELPGLDIATRAMFKAMNVTTVEALAAMSDVSGTNIMGFMKFRTLARGWLEQRAGQAPLVKMAADLEARDRRIKELEATNADILARVAALEDKGKADDPTGKPKAKAA